ncbi:hypothetical protein SOVF_199160, partial [Spinacia oleracea]
QRNSSSLNYSKSEVDSCPQTTKFRAISPHSQGTMSGLAGENLVFCLEELMCVFVFPKLPYEDQKQPRRQQQQLLSPHAQKQQHVKQKKGFQLLQKQKKQTKGKQPMCGNAQQGFAPTQNSHTFVAMHNRGVGVYTYPNGFQRQAMFINTLGSQTSVASTTSHDQARNSSTITDHGGLHYQL